MTITLPKDLEAQLLEQARRMGMDPAQYLATLIKQAEQTGSNTQSLAEMFEQFGREEQTDDPAEIQKRANDEAEFMEAMNRNRKAAEGPDARQVYP